MLRMRLAVLFLLLWPALPAWGQPKGKSDEIKKKDAKDEAVVRAKDRVSGYASLREVIQEYQGIIKENPKDADAHFTLALAYHAMGKLKQAEASYSQAIKHNPAEVDARFNLGAILQRQGKFKQAIRIYKETIATHPEMAEPYFNLGVIYTKTGNLSMAIAAYRTATEVSPSFALAHFQLAELYHRKLDFERAEQSYRRAVEVEPKFADAYNNLGNLFYEQGRSIKAMEFYKKAIEARPHDPEFRYNLGLTGNPMTGSGAAPFPNPNCAQQTQFHRDPVLQGSSVCPFSTSRHTSPLFSGGYPSGFQPIGHRQFSPSIYIERHLSAHAIPYVFENCGEPGPVGTFRAGGFSKPEAIM